MTDAKHAQFELCIRNLAGDVLLSIPNAWSGWTRKDVNAKLSANGHTAPASHYYRFVCSEGGELLLAGSRTLADLGPPLEIIAMVVANEAKPELFEAQEALLNSDINDPLELKSMIRPTDAVLSTCLAFCRLCNIQVELSSCGELDPSSVWDTVKAELLLITSTEAKKSIFDRIREHDPDAKPEEDLAALLDYVQDPHVTPEKVRKSSFFCWEMAKWLHALAKYDQLMVDGELGPENKET